MLSWNYVEGARLGAPDRAVGRQGGKAAPGTSTNHRGVQPHSLLRHSDILGDAPPAGESHRSRSLLGCQDLQHWRSGILVLILLCSADEEKTTAHLVLLVSGAGALKLQLKLVQSQRWLSAWMAADIPFAAFII